MSERGVQVVGFFSNYHRVLILIAGELSKANHEITIVIAIGLKITFVRLSVLFCQIKFEVELGLEIIIYQLVNFVIC